MTMNSVDIANNRLFRLRDDLPRDEHACAYCSGIRLGQVYWLVSSRPSSLGGYLGWYATTYKHGLGTSPASTVCENLPTRFMEPVLNQEPADFLVSPLTKNA